jgi:hypothetical protein
MAAGAESRDAVKVFTQEDWREAHPAKTRTGLREHSPGDPKRRT